MKSNLFLSAVGKILMFSLTAVIFLHPLASVQAASYLLEGVPCHEVAESSADLGSYQDAGKKGASCGVCDFLVVGFNGASMIMAISGAVAFLLFVYAGLLYLTVGGKPANAGKAKDVIVATLVGLVLIFSAYLVVNLVLTAIGAGDKAKILQNVWQNVTNPDPKNMRNKILQSEVCAGIKPQSGTVNSQ